MMGPSEIDLLERRLVEIDRALEENSLRLAASPPHGAHYPDYRRQEAESERRQLLADRLESERKIKQAKDALNKSFRLFRRRRVEPDAEHTRQASVLDIAEAEQRENIERFVRKLTTEGDHRQARVWRATLIGLRQRVAKEFGFTEA
jgi:hypothetical protein